MLFQPVTDLNCTSVIRHASTHTLRLEQSGNVHRQTCFFTGNGSSSPAHLPTLRTTLQWQSPRKKFHLPGSVSQHGLCSTDLSRKLARYSSLPKSSTEQALPYGHTFQGGTQYAGRSQRETRLANLRRLCPITNTDRTPTLHRRRTWARYRQHGLCSRRDNYRPVSIRFSLGAFPSSKSRYQTAYVARSTWQYPYVYPHLRWQTTRCLSPQTTTSKTCKSKSQSLLRSLFQQNIM